MGGVKREDYDWTHATKDIALLTHLTLHEASKLTFGLGVTDLVPYDAVPRVVELVNAEGGQAIGDALRVLLTGDNRPLYEVMEERRKAANSPGSPAEDVPAADGAGDAGSAPAS